MASYLFLLTIGPVQDFIAAARRTRDLWAGSQILSDLSREAAIYLHNQNATLIFPAPNKDNLDFKKHDVVNRIVAKIDVQTDEEMREFVREVQQNLTKIFQEKYVSGVFQTIATKVNKLQHLIVKQNKQDEHLLLRELVDVNLFYQEQAIEQLNDLLEISWAAVPFNEGNYNSVRELLERILAARKNTRDFKQPSWSQARQPKSSIDGQREAVIAEELYPKRVYGDKQQQERISKTNQQKLEWLWDTFNISGAERLSGVDLFKRHYQPQLHPNVDFPSTSHIAALPFIWRYVQTDYQGLKEAPEYKQLEGLRHFWPLHTVNQPDGEQEINFNKSVQTYAKNLKLIDQETKLKEGVVKQTSWISRFMPYDASILFESRLREITDSDELKNRQSKELKKASEELGKFYQQLNTTDRPSPYYAILLADGDAMGQAIDKLAEQGFALHQKFSQKLDVFASSVRNIVESHWGALIYSGGDDVLALLPLHSLLSCAQALHDKFDKTWEDFSELATKPTLSMGIAIAHYMEPLSDTLNLARNAEKKAKGFPGKNALAITLSKRSGSDRTVVGSWATDFYQRLLLLIHLYRTNAIPDGYAFELEDLWLRLGPKIDYAILRAEAKRIAKRKHAGRGSEELFKLAETLPVQKPEEKTAWSIEKFVDEMVIASELSRALGSIVTQPILSTQEEQE